MAKHDIKIIDTGGLNNVPTYRFQVQARNTSSDTAIYAGEPVKYSPTLPYVYHLADADFTVGTDVRFVGVCASDSTETASADGYVDVYMPLPGIIYEIKAKTGTQVDTQSEIDALCGKRVTIDYTSTTYTLDADAADAAGNLFTIIGGDPTKKTLKFMIRPFVNAVDGA